MKNNKLAQVIHESIIQYMSEGANRTDILKIWVDDSNNSSELRKLSRRIARDVRVKLKKVVFK